MKKIFSYTDSRKRYINIQTEKKKTGMVFGNKNLELKSNPQNTKLFTK